MTSELAENWFGPNFTVEFEAFFRKKFGLAYCPYAREFFEFFDFFKIAPHGPALSLSGAEGTCKTFNRDFGQSVAKARLAYLGYRYLSHETHVSVVVVNTGVSADHIVKFTGLVGVESGDEVVVRRAQGSNVLVDHRTERHWYSIKLAGLRCSMW